MKKLYSFLALALALVLFTTPVYADTVSLNFESPTYSLGNINSQDGWIKTGSFDVNVVTNSYGYASFDGQSLRMSDAITSGSFGDQAFAKPLVDAAGEADSTVGAFSPGVLQRHFEMQFDIASVLQSQQSGMHVSVSPDRGDGSRLSYLRFEDSANGINVFFDDVQGVANPANFVETQIATDLTRSQPHTIKLTLDALDGPSNDVVKVWIDGNLVHTGTSWENYYRYDGESAAEQSPRIIKTVLFRLSGTANTANADNGFLVDNLSIFSGPIPTPEPTTATVHIFKYIDGIQATSETASGVSFPMFTSTYNAPFTLGPAGWTTGDDAYEASTSPMSIGSAYSAQETLTTSLVGATCDGTHQYALLGYSTGDNLIEAQQSEPSLAIPSFTNLTGDKYVIVHNHLCPAVQTIKVHILKYLDGVMADPSSSSGYLFPMTATWQTSNLNGGAQASGNYVLGNNHGGATNLYGADTASMNVPASYSTYEVTDATSQVVSSLQFCAPGKYLLNGYRVSDTSFSSAQSQALSTIAPTFTGLTSDRYIIVDNSLCPTNGTISGMKFNDLNRNGKKDLAEPGLSGWTIRLKKGNSTLTAITASDGTYSFPNLLPGTYKIRETHQKGWKRISKNPKPIVISSGSLVTNVNFGNAQKRREEKEDDDRDDDRDEQSGNFYSQRGKNNYQRD